MYKLGDMSKAVNVLFAVYAVRRKTEAYVDGELTETFAANENFTGAVLPMTGKELRNLPEGEYDYEDKMIITDGSVDFNTGDRIVAFGREFEIRINKDVSDLVNLKTYTAKKI